MPESLPEYMAAAFAAGLCSFARIVCGAAADAVAYGDSGRRCGSRLVTAAVRGESTRRLFSARRVNGRKRLRTKKAACKGDGAAKSPQAAWADANRRHGLFLRRAIPCGLSFFFAEPHGLPRFFADPLDITISGSKKQLSRLTVRRRMCYNILQQETRSLRI